MTMELDFKEEAKQLSDRELKDIVIKRMYRGLMIKAAKEELEIRGISLTPDELKQKDLIRSVRIEEAKKSSNESIRNFFYNHSDSIVKDEAAPQLYTHRDLYLLSVLFSVPYGAIMLSMNFAKIGKQKYIWVIGLYSLCFIGLINYLQGYWHWNNYYLVNVIGYLPISLLWDKIIGKTKHRKKSMLIPMVIGLFLTIIQIWLLV